MTSIKPTIPTSNGIAQYRAKLRKAGTGIDAATACRAKPATPKMKFNLTD
jgi:hypothetical protein